MEATLTEYEFRKFAAVLKAASGIHLGPQKTGLLRTRLSKRLRTLGIASYREYLKRVVGDATGDELGLMVDYVSTNKTEFFREKAHFRHLQDVALPELLPVVARESGVLRLWSAACSSGEEAYSLAMLIQEALAPWAGRLTAKILATDISGRMLDRAMAGVYRWDSFHALPRTWVTKYVEKGRDRGEGVIRPELRRMVSFSRFNLNGGDFPFRRPFDAVFCRNVLMYFDRATQERLVNRMADALRIGGYLYTGMSESLVSIRHPMKTVSPAVYRRVR